MSSVKVGSLVQSHMAFSGVGKIASVNIQKKEVEIAFFHSPQNSSERTITVNVNELQIAELQLQSIVFCRFGVNQRWKQGFYDGARPNNQILVKFNSSHSDVFDIEDVYVPNINNHSAIIAQNFLKEKCTVSPILTNMRNKFFNSYIEQRIACESIPALLGSAVELESHQLAVVSRVLSDNKQKYLLCDEVGLGKTIEAGLILRHHVTDYGRDAKVFVLTPPALMKQWKKELESRFHLGDILGLVSDSLGDNFDEDQIIYIGEYKDITKLSSQIGKASMVIVDEAHHLSKLAWDGGVIDRFVFDAIAEISDSSICSLLLSGTPLVGKERDYLAMLHCLEPKKYALNEMSVERFIEQTHNQAEYVSLYRSLDPEMEDDDIESALEGIEELNLNDSKLESLIELAKPLVDFFNDEDVDLSQRKKAVLDLRAYFGDYYTTNFRMLRNRRDSSNGHFDNSNIEHLFPGLAPLGTMSWNLPLSRVLLDQQLDDLRGMKVSLKSPVLTRETYLSWIEALMLSPEYFAKKIKLDALTKSLSEEERDYWVEMLNVSKSEQIAKDEALIKGIIDWKEKHSLGKIVVFCGENSVADNVFKTLSTVFEWEVERHEPGLAPRFTSEEKIRVLVCDQHGEDGLNLQGKIRLAIHYSLPLELNRIEQRNGRLNRYCAQSKGVHPVQNMIMLPEREGFYNGWAKVLCDGIGTFGKYRASIQEPIDQFLGKSWTSVWEFGPQHLKKMTIALNSLNGLVNTELRRLELQDTMDKDTLDVRSSIKFSERMTSEDERFEISSTDLSNWISNGLLFTMKNGDLSNTFTMSFVHEKTRVNVSNLIKHCIIGLDFDNSTYANPKTHKMSFERTLCAESGAYPFRLGQPFVDAIYRLTSELPYGISSAFIRMVQAPIEPKLIFKTQWVSTYCEDELVPNQIRDDSVAKPMITETLYQSNGQVISEGVLSFLIGAPYSKKQTKVDAAGTVISYSDKNISIQKDGQDVVDLWEFVEQTYTQPVWEQSIDAVCEQSQIEQERKYKDQNPTIDLNKVSSQLLSLQAILLVGN